MTANHWLSFDYVLTKEPHAIRAVFVSDVHLSQYSTLITQAFLAFLDDLIALPCLQDFYIVGDWLEAWVGDDAYFKTSDHFLTTVVAKLALLSKKTNITVMCGNKDFMLSQRLCTAFGGLMVREPHIIKTHLGQIRLEHGDKLCTDDKSYQYYRCIIQNPITKAVLLALPLSVRLKLAGSIQQNSTAQKSQKTAKQMNTTACALAQATKNTDFLIHGHTHQPTFDGQVMVLGDWQTKDNQVSAHVGVLGDDLLLCHYCLPCHDF